MPYVNITLDMGVAVNAFKNLWNRKEGFKNVVIHLGDFSFYERELSGKFFLLIN